MTEENAQKFAQAWLQSFNSHDLDALAGVNRVTLYYRSINNMLAAEVMMFNPQGKVERVLAHYTQGS